MEGEGEGDYFSLRFGGGKRGVYNGVNRWYFPGMANQLVLLFKIKIDHAMWQCASLAVFGHEIVVGASARDRSTLDERVCCEPFNRAVNQEMVGPDGC